MTELFAIILAVFSFPWWPTPMTGQTRADSLSCSVSVSGVASSGKQSPYWIRTGRDGAVSDKPNSASLYASVYKAAGNPGRWFDYDFAVSGMVNTSGEFFTNLTYAHTRLLVFDITAGVKPLSYGPADERLSLGGLLFSRNALPLPRITIGIDEYAPVPGLFGYVELRGGLSHMFQYGQEFVSRIKVHHKFLGLRVGGKLPVNFTYEFHHAAQWGGYLSDGTDLGNSFSDFKNIFLGHGGGNNWAEQVNAQGNHLASQLLRMDVKWTGWNLAFYWQNLQDDGPIYFIGETMNKTDGLWGFNLSQTVWPFISGFTFEYFNTTDVSGPWHTKDGYLIGGDDRYYSNHLYTDGWTYFKRNIGNPLLSPLENLFRVNCFFAGFKGDVCSVNYRAVVSYSRSYLSNTAVVPDYTNLGWMIEASRNFPSLWGLDFALVLSGDNGSRFGNGFGAMLSIRKTFDICRW